MSTLAKRTRWLSGVIGMLLAVDAAHATDRYVPLGSGTPDYATIQDAVDASVDADVIHVAVGTYLLASDNPIRLNKGVTLVGDVANPGHVVLKAPPNGAFQGRASCIVISHPTGSVTIKGFTIKDAPMLGGSNQNAGIWVGHTGDTQMWPCDNVAIENNVIDNCANGINMDANHNVTIRNNVIRNSPRPAGTWTGIGINVYGRGNWRHTKNLVVEGNEIYGNKRSGIVLDNWENPPPPPWGPGGSVETDVWYDISTAIRDNWIYSNGSDFTDVNPSYGVRYRGIEMYGHQKSIAIERNIVFGHTSDSTKLGTSAGILAYQCKDVGIKHNRIYGNLRGIRLYGAGGGLPDETTGHLVESNTVYGNVQGLQVDRGGAGSAANNSFTAHTDTSFVGVGVPPHGVINSGAGTFNAENNWWGDVAGPADPLGTDEAENPPCFDASTMRNANGTGDAVSDLNVDYCPWLKRAATLTLNVLPTCIYVKPGQSVTVNMDVSDLAQKVNACQAMLGFSSMYLIAAAGCVAPGGGAWDLLIYNTWDLPGGGTPGEIDTAIGVQAQGAVGTDADGRIAIVTLIAGGVEGSTQLVFRPDADPDPGLLKSTYLSDLAANPVWPSRQNSQTIAIDGTAPVVDSISADQGGPELTPSGIAVQGPVSIAVATSDNLSGVAGAPTVTVTPNGGSAEAATLGAESPPGTYNYTWSVTSTTPNGPATITVSGLTDRSGNVAADATDTFVVDKNQAAVTVEFATWRGPGSLPLPDNYAFTRVVRLVATNLGATVLKTWTPTLSFSNNPATQKATASCILTNVPAGMAHLSAKTAWHLRKRLDVALDLDGQASAAFTLLGGDLNESNSVNVLDYSLMKTSWGGGTAGDINGDAKSWTEDYSIMQSNWFIVGDPR